MASPALYCSLTAFKEAHSIQSTDSDGMLVRLLQRASEGIDRLCRAPAGYFAETAEAAVRYLDVPAGGAASLVIPAAQTLTAVKTDENGDRTYEVTWSASLDYRLYPLDGPPYTEIRVDPVNGRYRFPPGQARLQLTGTFGDAVGVPGVIEQMTMLQANRWRFRAKSPDGMAGNAEVGFVTMGDVDPDIAAMLQKGGYVQGFGVA